MDKKWKNYSLGEICRYSIEKININDVTNKNYISTENMIPNKGGIIESSSLPNAKSVSKYEKGDTLISNIRPYFKKIWFSDKIGGASNDVLVVKGDDDKVLNKYLYYLLTQDKFFDYVMGSSKGTKMPRGDKSAILKYEVKLPPLVEQKSIAKKLSDLDEKIEINNKINDNLEKIAQAIFKQWFVDFEFPCIPENYKFSGAGKPCNPNGAGKPCSPDGAGKPADFDKVCTYKRVGGLPVPDGKSWFVYVLLCEDGSFYKGMTKDLYRRFYEHYIGIGAEWTKTHKPVKVIHYEKFSTQEEARKREEELKSGYGREWIKREYKKYTAGSPAHQISMNAGSLAHQSGVMNSGLPAHEPSEMNAGKPAHQTRLMMAGEMIESELGEIPKGWSIKTIGDISNIVSKGTTPTKNDIDNAIDDNTIKFIKVKDISSEGVVDLSNIEYIPESIHFNKLKRSVLEYKDILLSIAGTIGRVSYVDKDLVNSNTNQAVAFIRLNDIDNFFLLVLYKFKNDDFQNSLKSKVVQGVQANISLTVIKNEKIVIPNNKILEKYNDIINNIFNKKDLINIENNRLKSIRDTLLPKLMSGEIRVSLEEN